MKKAWHGQEGLTIVAVLVYIAIAAVLYFAYLYAPMGWRFYQVREAVGRTANFALTMPDDNYVRFKCSEFLRRDAGMQAKPEQCILSRDRNGTKVTVTWSYDETISYFPTDRKEIYHYDVRVESDALK